MSNSNNLRTDRIYYGTKKLVYLLMTNLYFLMAISPFLIYFLAAGEGISFYILFFLGIIIGPALSTLFSVVGRFEKGEETSAKKDFLHFYKLNFLQGIFSATIISLILMVSYLDIEYFFKINVDIIAYIFLGIGGITLALGLYVFTIISRINAKTFDVFKVALETMIKKIHITITMITIIVVFLVVVKFFKISLIAVLFGPVFLAYIILIIEKNILIDAENYLKEKYENLDRS